MTQILIQLKSYLRSLVSRLRKRNIDKPSTPPVTIKKAKKKKPKSSKS